MPRIGADRPALAVDTETTGVDFHHGARPFFVTMCDADGKQQWWEWDVDPLTRRVIVPDGDLREVEQALQRRTLVLQNAKFDVAALRVAGIDGEWPWAMTHDTLIAGHLLASNLPHDLTSMAMQYLGVDIAPLEAELSATVQAARSLARSKFPEWMMAKQGLPNMPSAGSEVYRADYWLPRAVAVELNYPDDHAWYRVLSEYANADSAVTLPLWQAMMAEVDRRGLRAIYEERRKLVKIVYRMESSGVTIDPDRLSEVVDRKSGLSASSGSECVSIARGYGYDLQLPKGGVNKSLKEFCFGVLDLPRIANPKSKTGEPTLDSKRAIPHYLETLTDPVKHRFVEMLSVRRTADTAITALNGYARFMVKSNGSTRLHPRLNPTGTHTLRWSSSDPNEQSIDKKDPQGSRLCFGPAKGREWWSLDGKNLELRIPSYESGEEEMIELFERPDDPPFYGSNHMLVFSFLWPDLWDAAVDEVGLDNAAKLCKKKYEGTQYKWTKNGNFAVLYGAVEREGGTADVAYHRRGAHAAIKSRFAKMERLNQKYVDMAERLGYVETIPDRDVDPSRGYPLLCARGSHGRVLPTVPLNYHVQGTACWWMCRAMVKVEEIVEGWRREGFDAFITIQVHDELVLDLPKGAHPVDDPRRSNLPRVRAVRRAMESCGDAIGVPTPVSIEYHERTWAEGVTL